MARAKRRSANRDTAPGSDLRKNRSSSDDRPSRRELLVVAILLLVGIGLRVAFPSRMAVEHFDEGVYASNFWFGAESNYQYPMRRLYAPPLLPSCIEWSMIFNLAGKESPRDLSPLAPMIPSLVAGCLTLLVAWKLSRDWFGKQAALATLTLASLSDVHALYSRTALTEAMLLLLFVAAVWSMHRALSKGSYLHVGLAGLLTGLAWWTKYNGWLPLAVGFGGLVVGFAIHTSFRKRALQKIGFLAGIAAIAFAVWSPYLRELQAYGGYAEVAANHRQYLVGFAGWWSSLLRQHANLAELDGWASCIAVGGSLLLCSGTAFGNRNSIVKLCTLALALIVAATWLGSATTLLIIGVAFGARELYVNWRASDSDSANDHLALYFLAAWVAGLLLATPLYHPYPRLTLPLLAGLWIAMGLAGTKIIDFARPSNSNGQSSKRWNIGIVIAAVAFAISIPRMAANSSPAWQSRTGWQLVAKEIVAEVGQRAESMRGNRDEAIIVVYGEPGLFFHLNVEGTQVVAPVGDFSSINNPDRDTTVPTFLVTGPHAERTAGFHSDLAHTSELLQEVAGYTYIPSNLVLLNQSDANATGANAEQRVVLYQVEAVSN